MNVKSKSNRRGMSSTSERQPHHDLSNDPPPSYSAAINETMNHSPQPWSSTTNRAPTNSPPNGTRSSPSTTPTLSSPNSSPLRPRLSQVIAIPATVSRLDSPFLRAYPPALEAFSIPMSTFLNFLDNLNRVAVTSPPLQVLATAGDIVSFIPETTAQIVGASISAAAQISSAAISYGRTEIELRKANAETFGPKGLKVEIARIDAVARLTGMPILNSQGKVDKRATLLKPLDELEEGGLTISGQQRRLDTMQPWIAHLEMTPLPETRELQNPLDEVSIKISERIRVKGETKLIKKRGQAHSEYKREAEKVRTDFDKEMNKIYRNMEKEMRKLDAEIDKVGLSSKPDTVAKVEREKEKALAKYEKQKRKEEKEYEKEMREIEKDQLSDDEEEKHMRKILWLIIREKDAFSGYGPNPDVPDPEGWAELP
ncbi:uncharacterized protein Z518_02075 [Rhinocladiella mackenziei CBS 650.93]|uniref:Uncharacterized protein n=1 Tax=Rhinocladiella mackenziei CBS 650.93 TaxID=1442369 RepID=A0A0D2FYQ3_9EURO|nr:uncharacterized protein Z518_02075 [Rhinocladiella mackenziei CBS 650.93]KIX07422.1 hypothetical protein Z518_02075 [Rhinocladiella mackenziei CBS 650.93]